MSHDQADILIGMLAVVLFALGSLTAFTRGIYRLLLEIREELSRTRQQHMGVEVYRAYREAKARASR